MRKVEKTTRFLAGTKSPAEDAGEKTAFETAAPFPHIKIK
jgi:hypothetical protein